MPTVSGMFRVILSSSNSASISLTISTHPKHSLTDEHLDFKAYAKHTPEAVKKRVPILRTKVELNDGSNILY